MFFKTKYSLIIVLNFVISFAFLYKLAIISNLHFKNQKPTKLKKCQDVEYVYYDKSYKTGGSAIKDFIKSFKNDKWKYNPKICDHGCAGISPMQYAKKYSLLAEHKAWESSFTKTDVKGYYVTSIRNPADRILSFYRYHLWYANKKNRKLNESEWAKAGTNSLRFWASTHNPHSLHEFYDCGGSLTDEAIVKRYDCVINIYNGSPLQDFSVSLHKITNSKGKPISNENTKPFSNTKIELKKHWGIRTEMILSKEMKLYEKFLQKSNSANNCKCI